MPLILFIKIFMYYSLVSGDSFVELLKRCFTLLHGMKTKAPLELFWVLFALSCRCDTHSVLTEESVIHALLDICTYEIYQKSDPRPLVKVMVLSYNLVLPFRGFPRGFKISPIPLI